MVVENRKPTIKEQIEERFGSINKFLDDKFLEMKRIGISRSYVYSLINNELCNPTVEIMNKLSELTGIPYEEISNEYCVRYRDQQSDCQYAD